MRLRVESLLQFGQSSVTILKSNILESVIKNLPVSVLESDSLEHVTVYYLTVRLCTRGTE